MLWLGEFARLASNFVSVCYYYYYYYYFYYYYYYYYY